MIVNNTYCNDTKPPKYMINGHQVRSMYYNGNLIFHHIPCDQLILNVEEISLTLNGSFELKYTIVPMECNEEVLYESTDESVATIENGIIIPHEIGNCTIKVTCGNVTANCKVNIKSDDVACSDITFDMDSLTIGINAGTYNVAQYVNVTPISCQLPVTWYIDKTSIATIDSNGIITPKGVGNCTLTATCGDKSVTLPVYIEAEPIEILIDEITIEVGETYDATKLYELQPGYGVQYKYTAIISIQNHIIIGEEVGTTNLEIICGDTIKNVTVHVIASSIVLPDEVTCTGITLKATPSNTISVGEEVYINVTISPSNCTENYTMSTSGSAIGENGYAGLYIGNSVGSSTVTVRCGNVSESITIYVTN